MKNNRIEQLEQKWASNPRWEGVTRPYSAEKVIKLQGSYPIEHTIAKQMATLRM